MVKRFISQLSFLLNKLQSIDSRAIKIALGIPVHSNTFKTYQISGILPLDQQRKLATSNYLLKYLALPISEDKEKVLISSNSFPKQARNIQYLKTIRDYTQDIFEECNIDPFNIQSAPLTSSIPPWETKPAEFDIDYYTEPKNENYNLIASDVRNHLNAKYQFNLRIFTDGSVLEDANSGCGFAYQP